MTRNFSRGFTMLELLIVIAVIAILATIAYPAFIGALERAKVTKDMNNLRQIGIATQLYMNDNDGALFSTTGSWMTQLYPKDTDPAGATVLGNGGGTATSTPGGGATAGTQSNRQRINALFADLHVETMSW